MKPLTGPQDRMLDEIVMADSVNDGMRSYNGRARRSLSALRTAGLIEWVSFTLVPHADGRYTEEFLVRPTPDGRAYARDGWEPHQPIAPEAPIPGRHWYSGCDPDGPLVRPDGICEGCGERACPRCGHGYYGPGDTGCWCDSPKGPSGRAR